MMNTAKLEQVITFCVTTTAALTARPVQQLFQGKKQDQTRQIFSPVYYSTTLEVTSNGDISCYELQLGTAGRSLRPGGYYQDPA